MSKNENENDKKEDKKKEIVIRFCKTCKGFDVIANGIKSLLEKEVKVAVKLDDNAYKGQFDIGITSSEKCIYTREEEDGLPKTPEKLMEIVEKAKKMTTS